MKFADLRLAEPILRAVADQGYELATPIQAQAIPHALEGRDVLGSAQTGTGKTAAFALPILHRLAETAVSEAPAAAPVEAQSTGHRKGSRRDGRGGGDTRRGPARPTHPVRRARVVVLCPTRELAGQIAESFSTYGAGLRLRHVLVYGGVNQNPQVRALRAGIDIIIATPGRLLDLMNQGHVDLRGVEALILDEADRMLDMGFIHDIRKVVSKVPADRQTMMFSATMPGEIRRFADDLLRDPATINVDPETMTVDAIDQSVFFVGRKDKPKLLAHVLAHESISRAIIFTRTKHGADRVVKHLRKADLHAQAIHGNKSQNARQRAMDAFRAGRIHILVATDVAARGIDVDGISHVVNYDLTHEPETYVHRIGRTARAGATGHAISFCDAEEFAFLRAIQKLIGTDIPVRDDGPAGMVAPTMPTGGGTGGAPSRKPRARRGGPPRTGSRNNSRGGGGGGGKPRRPARTDSGSGNAPRNGKSRRRRNSG